MPRTPRRSRQHKDNFRMDRSELRKNRDRREQESHEAVQKLLVAMAEKPRPMDGRSRTLDAIDDAVAMAMHCHQFMAVSSLLRLQAQIEDLIVQKQAVVLGKPSDYADDDPEEIYAGIRERLGAVHERRFRAFIENRVIEGEAEEIEDDP